MPANGTMAAPFGRVMSGRGFAPASFQAHDIPAVGQFTKDLPDVGSKPNMEAWLQQAKMAKNLQLFGQGFRNTQIPSAMPDSRRSGAMDDAEVQNPAKRPRMSIPEYGRSASDPPLSFARRNANSLDMPVDALRLDAMKQNSADLPKALRSIQSGPARLVDGRPSPNYRIYSNAFQGGRVAGDGAPLNYSHSKAVNASLTKAAPSPSQGGVRANPTPHPALLKQPLLGKRPPSDGPALATAPQKQPDQATVSESEVLTQQLTDPALTEAQAELTARLQHMQSIVRGHPNPKLTVKPKPVVPNPQPAASPTHSVSHDSHSNEDTEMEEASHGSHGVSEAPVPRASESPRESAPKAKGRSPGADAPVKTNDRLPLSRKSPSHVDGDSVSPQGNSGMPFGGGASPQAKDKKSTGGGAPAIGDSTVPMAGSTGLPDFKLPGRKPGSAKTDLPIKGRSARPWSNLSSALQPPAATPDPFTAPQLQSVMAGSTKRNGAHQGEAAEPVTEAVQQWLNQLSEATGKTNGQRPILPRISSQEHLFAGQNPNLPRPIQAQLHVMRDSFNRIARPHMADQSQLPAFSLAATSASFPPPGFLPAGHEHQRGLLAPKQDAAHSLQHQLPLPISSSTRSSLPPSVASWLEQDQQRRQQLQGRSQVGISQQMGLNMGFAQQQLSQGHSNASLPGHDQDYARHLQANSSRGYGQSSRPLDTVRVSNSKDWYDNLGSGFGLPSRVIAEGAVRNPALLNRPVLSSHRDPQPGPTDQDLGFQRAGSRGQQGHSVLPQAPSGRAFSSLNGSSSALQHAQQESSLSPHLTGASFPPSYSRLQNHRATSTVHALAAMLGNSNLSSADVSQLCSIAGSTHAGNLNQLISQLQMATQLAQAHGESAQPLVETTHRVVIPAAHLKEGSHAISRQNAASVVSGLAQNTAATVADGRNFTQYQQQQGRMDESKAPWPQSALDVVAEAAAAAAANEEPSELLMLAAETLAGLNNMQPRSSGDHPKSASASMDHSSNDSPPAARKLGRQLGDRKQRPRKAAATQKPMMHTSSAAAVHANDGNASVHPVLGLYVPHARRSYHRDGTATGAKGSLMGNSAAAEGRLPAVEGRAPFASSRPSAAAPARGRQRKGPSSGNGPAKPAAVLRRMPSDSSMTVSADSNA